MIEDKRLREAVSNAYNNDKPLYAFKTIVLSLLLVLAMLTVIICLAIQIMRTEQIKSSKNLNPDSVTTYPTRLR